MGGEGALRCKVRVRNAVGQGPTLVVVRSTTGHTFGGYAHAPWTSAGSYTNTAGCFLFLVENPHNDAPTCFECKSAPHAMYCAATFGPTFGGGHDLGIHAGGDPGTSYTNFPYSYTDTLGRGAAAAVPAPRIQQAVTFAWKPGPHECSKLLNLVRVLNAPQQSAA